MSSAAATIRTIDFNKRFRSLLETLKMVAIAQYYSLERQLKGFELVTDVAADILSVIDSQTVDHPFIKCAGKPMGIVAITSESGLVGGLNGQVMTKALELLDKHTGELFIVGNRGQLFAQDLGIAYTSFPGILDSHRAEQACELRDKLLQAVISGAVGPITVVYPKASSLASYKVEADTLLPFKSMDSPDKPIVTRNRIFESSPEDVIGYVVYLLLGRSIDEIFGRSRLAEQAARFTHLEESCQKLLEANQKLLLVYFKKRHEIIDNNMRELFAARSLYADS